MLLLVKNARISGRLRGAMLVKDTCHACGSSRYKKNGHTRHGKQNHWCKNCERQFSAGAANRLIAAERRAEIANLLREASPCAGFAVRWASA